MNKILGILVVSTCLAEEIKVGWAPVPKATSYAVSYGSDTISFFKTVSSTNIVIDVPANKTYWVSVKSINDKNESVYSKPIIIQSQPAKNVSPLMPPRPFVIGVPNQYGHAN
jgi:hypothetical protein